MAETLNLFFKNSIADLDISENRLLQNDTQDLTDPVDIALKNFNNHPIIIEIRKVVDANCSFSFSAVTAADIEAELRTLKSKKASKHLDIPAKHLKQVTDLIL